MTISMTIALLSAMTLGVYIFMLFEKFLHFVSPHDHVSPRRYVVVQNHFFEWPYNAV